MITSSEFSEEFFEFTSTKNRKQGTLSSAQSFA